MGCPTKKFEYGKDCLCENPTECRGLTAAFSMLGNDPRSHFVRLPNYKASPTDPYFIERNQQREAYLRYLLPHHPVEQTTLAKDVALHHFHPRIVARLVSKMQKNIPKTMTEKELKRLKLKIHRTRSNTRFRGKFYRKVYLCTQLSHGKIQGRFKAIASTLSDTQ